MDVGLSFRYVFDDKRWPGKTLIALLVSIVPILNIAWQGYLIQVMRNVSDRASEPLPDWSDFGKKFVDGLIILVAGFIYALPIIILAGIVGIGAGVTEAFSSGDLSEATYGIFTGLGVLVSCIIILYSILLAIFLPALSLHYAREDRFAACFQVGKITRLITSNLGDYAIAWLVAIFTGFIIGLLAAIIIPILVITCCLIPLAIILGAFISVWPMLVYAHLFAQIARPVQTELEPFVS